MGEKTADQLKEEGLALFNQGKRDEALRIFQQAAAKYEEADNILGQGEMLNNLGVIYRFERQWPEAEESLTQADRIFGEAGDPIRQAQVRGNLGDLASRRKDYERAEQLYSSSSELFASAGEQKMQAEVLRALSLMQTRRRNLWAAVDTMQQSLKVRPKLSLPQRMLSWLLQLAMKVLSGGQ